MVDGYVGYSAPKRASDDKSGCHAKILVSPRCHGQDALPGRARSAERILLFDEATSALDNRTQAIVSASLENLKATRIVIAHRLSTIMNADRIYVPKAGRIVQSGTYAELMGQEGPFKDLAVRQIA